MLLAKQGLNWNKKLLYKTYCTFPMGKQIIVCNNVPTIDEWPTNF